MTNLPDMRELDGCHSGERERHLAVNLDERMHQTASWSLWAPGLRAAIKTSLLVLVEWYGIAPPKLPKSLGLDQWKQHIKQGHQPYRRDCRTCILNMAGSKPHRRREHAGSSAWTMFVDLVNLLPNARDLATKKIVKYGVVATALVPVFDSPPGDEPSAAEQPIVAGDVSSDAPRPMETVDAFWGEGLDEKEYSLQGDEKPEENPIGDDSENVKDHDRVDGNETDYEPIMGEDESKEWESKSLEKAVGELSQPVKLHDAYVHSW